MMASSIAMDSQRLTVLAQSENVPQQWPQHQAGVIQFMKETGFKLLSQPHADIQQICRKLPPKQLNGFLEDIISCGVESGSKSIDEFLASLVDLEKIRNAIESRNAPFNVDEIIANWASLMPVHLKTNLFADLAQGRSHLLYFIPNMISTFVGAFRFHHWRSFWYHTKDRSY